MSLHEAAAPRATPEARELAEFFNARWGDSRVSYEATGDTVTEYGPRDAYVIPVEDLRHHRESVAFLQWRATTRQR